jgi:hypothetical protein
MAGEGFDIGDKIISSDRAVKARAAAGART